VINAARLSEKPITPATATAAILLFKTGSPKAGGRATSNSRRRLLQDPAQDEAVSLLRGMFDALDQVAAMLAKGATPADDYIPAGDAGTYVSLLLLLL